MVSKYTKQNALKHIKKGDFDFILDNLVKFGDLDEEVAAKLIEEGYEYDVLENLEKFAGEKSTKLAIKIIQSDSELGPFNVVQNLDKFTDLDISVAYLLLEKGEDISEHLDKFTGEKSNTLAIAIITADSEFGAFNLTQCLNHFTNLNKGIAEQLIEFDESYGVAKNLKSFEKLDASILYKLLEKEEDIFDNLESFAVGKDSKLALKIIESDTTLGTFNFIQIIEKFSDLNRQVAEILIKDGYGYVVLNNLNKFSDVDISLAILLSKSGESMFVLENLKEFSGEKSSELALTIIEDVTEILFADYLAQFQLLNKEVAEKMLEDELVTDDVINNISAFDKEAIEYILSLYPAQTTNDEHSQKSENEEVPDFPYTEDSNHYEILGISFNASESEVKTAFRRLASLYHPDKGGNEKHFKLVTQAYTVLKNTEKRKLYDTQFSHQKDQSSDGSKTDESSNVMDDEEEVFHRNNKPEQKAEEKTKKTSSFIFGVILLSIGLVITLGSYASASGEGGSYVVTWGLIIYGLYLIFKDTD